MADTVQRPIMGANLITPEIREQIRKKFLNAPDEATHKRNMLQREILTGENPFRAMALMCLSHQKSVDMSITTLLNGIMDEISGKMKDLDFFPTQFVRSQINQQSTEAYLKECSARQAMLSKMDSSISVTMTDAEMKKATSDRKIIAESFIEYQKNKPAIIDQMNTEATAGYIQKAKDQYLIAQTKAALIDTAKKVLDELSK